MNVDYLRGYADGIRFAIGDLRVVAERQACAPISAPGQSQTTAPPTRFTIFYTPTISWEHACIQRPHHLMRAFARLGHTVIYGEPDKSKRTIRPEPNLTVVSDEIETRAMLAASDNPIVVWVSCPPTFAAWKSAAARHLVVYDILDDPASPEFAQWQAGLPELQARADCCVAVTDALRCHANGKPCELAPNGVWLDHFAPGPRVLPSFWPPAAGKSGRPVIGYWGAIMGWVDCDLVAALARARAQFDFVVVGPDYTGRAAVAWKGIENLFWVGPIAHQDLPAWGRCFDAGIVPFHRGPATDNCDPIKVREYLAMGLPVVSVDLPALGGTPHVSLAGDREQWISMLNAAVAEKNRPDAQRDSQEQRRESVRRYDWQAIAERCIEHVRKLECSSRR